MGLLSFLSGAKQADKLLDIGDKATSGIINGVDKMFYTAEEKSEAAQKITDTYLEFLKTTLSESSVRSITRRIVAVMIMALFSAAFLFTVAAWKLDREWAEFCLKTTSEFGVGNLTLMVAVFFFGTHALASFVRRK